MPSRQVEQKSFETGEVGQAHIWRADLKVRASSVKRARNVRILVSGGLEARPGTERLATLPGDGVVREMVVGDTAYMLVLTHEAVAIWDMDSRTLVQTITGCDWTLTMIQDDETPLTVDAYDRQARVFHPNMLEQVIERSELGVWSVSDDLPAPGIGGSVRQPYYRYAARDVSLTPSATSGVGVTLTASDPYFSPGHVGLRLTLQGREVEVTAVSTASSVTATVIQQLYPTRTVTVADTTGYEPGEIVQGDISQTKGEVVAVNSGTQLTVLMRSFTDFIYDGAATPPGEQLIGVNKTSRLSAATAITTPAAVLDFSEQAESGVRGWCATGTVHRNRLWKARLFQSPFAVLASAIGDFQDFSVGEGDNDAIFELVGDTRAGVVRHVISSEQLLLGTSRGIYYYPESEANPIRPTSFSLNQIGPDGLSACRPVLISEGVMAVENGGGTVLGIFPTGDVRRSWRVVDLSLLSNHLIASPRSLAYVSGGETDPERYVYAANQDGTAPVVYYSDSAEVFGWTLWETAGVFRNLAAYKGECWAVVRRMHGATPVFSLEAFDAERFMDACVDVESGDLQGPAAGETIQTPDGPVAADKVYRAAALAGATCSLMIGEAYIGEVTLDDDGDFGVPDLDGDIVLGRNFFPEVETWPPMEAEDQRSRRRKQRISGAIVRWMGRYLAINGRVLPVYRGGENTALAPPLRDEEVREPCFGWEDEPTVTITRPFPGPWRMYGVSLEVKN